VGCTDGPRPASFYCGSAIGIIINITGMEAAVRVGRGGLDHFLNFLVDKPLTIFPRRGVSWSERSPDGW